MSSTDLARLLRGFGHIVAAAAIERTEAGEYVMLESTSAFGDEELRPVAWGTRSEQSEIRPIEGAE